METSIPVRIESAAIAAMRGELISLIAERRLLLTSEIHDDTPLISSGCLDSLTLFNLVGWIESKIGRSIDPGSVDIVAQWDSVGDILQYIHGELSAPRRDDSSLPRLRVQPSALSGYEIVKYDPSYKREVAQFQTGSWSPDPTLNLRYLEWKYEANPYQQGVHIYLALHNGEIVGMRGFHPSRWQIGSASHRFDAQVADSLLIREDHRTLALISYLMETAYQDLRGGEPSFLFNLSGGPLTVVGSLTNGWRSAGNLKPMRRSSAGARFYASLRAKLSRVPYLRRHVSRLRHPTELRPFAYLDHVRETSAFAHNGIPISIEKSPRSEAMAALIEQLGHDGRLRHVRDREYFDWRFQNPLHEYRFLFAGGERLDGYLVLKRWVNPSISRVNLVDLEATNDHVRLALLRTAVEAGAFADLVVWTAGASPELLTQLNDLEFKPIEDEQTGSRAPCILVRPVENERLDEEWLVEGKDLLDPKNWDIRMIYSMAG